MTNIIALNNTLNASFPYRNLYIWKNTQCWQLDCLSLQVSYWVLSWGLNSSTPLYLPHKPSMSSQNDVAAGDQSASSIENDPTTGDSITVTIGATVPTGFEHTAAEEVKEKIGVDAHISKDRGRIYFPVTTDKLFQVWYADNSKLSFDFEYNCNVCESVAMTGVSLCQIYSVLYLNMSFCLPLCTLDSQVHLLRSVDNLFVVVEEYDHYQFKESKVAYIQLYFIV